MLGRLCLLLCATGAVAFFFGGYMFVSEDQPAGGNVPQHLFTKTNIVWLSLLDPANLSFPDEFAMVMHNDDVRPLTKMVTIGGEV
jgi:hypothetical protein